MSLRFRPNRQVPQGVGGILLVGYAFDFLTPQKKPNKETKILFFRVELYYKPPE